MATTTLTPAASAYRSGLYEWLTTTDHKKIGILYVVNSFIFFFLGGILASARFRFIPLLAALGSPTDAVAKELELYIHGRIPDDYSLTMEIDGLDRFAAEHKTALPFVVDPKGDLAAAVNADRDLGKRIGIDHTPTVYVVSSKTGSAPFVEVKKPQEELFQTIDALKR